MPRGPSRPVVADPGLLILVLRGLERPVIEQRPAHDVRPGHKAPVARVEAVVPVVAHHEVLARRNHQVPILDVIGKVHGPGFGVAPGSGIRAARRETRRESRDDFPASSVAAWGWSLSHAVDDDDAVAQMDVVAGNADQPLHQKQVLRLAVRIRSGTGLRKTTISPRRGSR